MDSESISANNREIARVFGVMGKPPVVTSIQQQELKRNLIIIP